MSIVFNNLIIYYINTLKQNRMSSSLIGNHKSTSIQNATQIDLYLTKKQYIIHNTLS